MPKLKIKNMPVNELRPTTAELSLRSLRNWYRWGITQQILRDWRSILSVCGAKLLWIPSWPRLRLVCRSMAIAVGPLWKYVKKQPKGDASGWRAEKCRACGWLTNNNAVETATCDECGQYEEVCELCTNVTPSGARCAVCTPREREPTIYHALNYVATVCEGPFDDMEMCGISVWKRKAVIARGRGCVTNHVTPNQLVQAWKQVTQSHKTSESC